MRNEGPYEINIKTKKTDFVFDGLKIKNTKWKDYFNIFIFLKYQLILRNFNFKFFYFYFFFKMLISQTTQK